jgi:periplasmic copper chaperone A
MKSALFKHALVSVTAAVTVVMATGGIVSAHIDPDPIAVQAGTSATVAFKVEHGCDGSPTTSMKFQIPDGVTDVVAVDKAGWTASVSGNVLEFTGGPLAADEEDHFDITFTAPAAAGEIGFPVIQTCEQGELAWIEPNVEGAEEPERPAPIVKITEGAPTAEDLTPEHEEGEGTEGTVVATDTAAVPSTVAGSADGSSNTGTIVVVVVVVAIVLVGAGVVLARRRSTAPKI